MMMIVIVLMPGLASHELWKMHINRQLGQETCPYASNQMYNNNIAECLRVAQQPDCKQLAAMMDTGKHLASMPCFFTILKNYF